MTTPTRRQILAGSVSAGLFALAGCVSGGNNSGGSDDSEPESEEDVADWRRIDGEILSKSVPMELTEAGTTERVAEVHWHSNGSHWHKMPLEIPHDRWRSVEMRVLDSNLEPIPLGEDESYDVDVRRTETTPADLVEISVSGGLLDIHGENEGTGELVFQLLSDGEAVWTTPALTIQVGSAS